MENAEPGTHPELVQALEVVERDVASFMGALDDHEFVTGIDGAWSPAEHLAHLNIAVNAVARGLSLPRLLVRLRFGRSRRESRSFRELRDDYRARLAAGGKASGPFIPVPPEPSREPAAARQELLARWARVNQRLRRGLLDWSEADLDGLQMPHPILGKITVREMVFFTIYHGGHHVAAARSRLSRFTR